jgi:hypothetical protein
MKLGDLLCGQETENPPKKMKKDIKKDGEKKRKKEGSQTKTG